jgi:hypothetical protein
LRIEHFAAEWNYLVVQDAAGQTAGAGCSIQFERIPLQSTARILERESVDDLSRKPKPALARRY